MKHICLNGKIIPAKEPALRADNRGYRYGDGLFETMKIVDNRICLADLHFERLFAGLELLKFEVPKHLDAKRLNKECVELCKKNGCEKLGRVRLSVSRGHGGLYEDSGEMQYIIECHPLDETVNQLNENGLIIGVFPDARKCCDVFSHLKSANFLPYVMAARYAKDHQLNDCLVLNPAGNIADATIANLFLIKQGELITPALSEGCVDGVMRRYLMEKWEPDGYRVGNENPITMGSKIESLKLKVVERRVSIEDLLAAEEVFLTNAVNGMRWIKQFREKMYINDITRKIYKRMVQNVF